ncbi:hypothetical protein GCM10009761_24110 [Agromyces terreus]
MIAIATVASEKFTRRSSPRSVRVLTHRPLVVAPGATHPGILCVSASPVVPKLTLSRRCRSGQEGSRSFLVPRALAKAPRIREKLLRTGGSQELLVDLRGLEPLTP